MEILKKILNDKENRKQLILEFQELVWNNENESELLSELAYDLDFYEPFDEWRKEDPSYFGDEQLERQIISVMQQLKDQHPEL